MGLRLVDAGSESCRYILTQMGAGHSIALVPGGAAEMLDSCLGDYILTLNRRKQFIKMALETGSSLVPVFGFGQNDSFKIPSFANYEWLKSYKSSNTSLLKKWSKLMIKGIVISFSGKYIPGLPYNNPITVVVGSPIHVKQVTSPSDEQIDQLHTQYSMEIRRLFENNRNKYGIPSETKLIIQ
ncbi:diacylglycerol O-acyltransferase 2-like protein 6 [Porites lutea]|uniref:diacylglycerol O-acyltransferase 2-like protein 6 n=1 Tax=Porites lutea TaxID=51062 RepID=UPI003CC5CB28